jgi:hypothetical protein
MLTFLRLRHSKTCPYYCCFLCCEIHINISIYYSVVHYLLINDKKPFCDTNPATMISSERCGENPEDGGGRRGLEGYGERKELQDRMVKSYERLGMSEI